MASNSGGYIPTSSPPIPGNGNFGTPGQIKSYGDFGAPRGVMMRDLKGRFAAGGWGFQWEGLEGVMDLPNAFARNIEFNIQRNVAQLAKVIEKYAQDNAPWTDRSGNARRGLHTTSDANVVTGLYIINLGYSVDYGYYLETHNGGVYAIVGPTMQLFAPDMAGLIVASNGRNS